MSTKTLQRKPTAKKQTQASSRQSKVVREVLDSFAQQANQSAMLLQHSVEDSLATFVRQMITNPLQAVFSTHERMENTVLSVLHTIVVSFFSCLPHNTFHAIYRLSEQDMYYFLVLEEDSLWLRAEIYQFLSWYESNNTMDIERFPIYFHFVPKSLMLELAPYLEIKL
jgi:hypothetical protein